MLNLTHLLTHVDTCEESKRVARCQTGQECGVDPLIDLTAVSLVLCCLISFWSSA